MRAMDSTGRPIHKKGFIRRVGTMLLQPPDGLVCHIFGEVVFLIVRGFDRDGVFKQARLILGGLPGEETVEILEAVTSRPMVEGAHGRGLVRRRVMPFAKGGGLVAVEAQHFGNRGGGLRNYADVSVPIHSSLSNGAGTDTMMVTPGQQCCPRGRANRGSVKPVEADAFIT